MSLNVTKKIMLITCALPYANGPIHLGHMLEHIQADIWVRYQKMRGNQVFFICADDAHGTPIMLKAKKLKKKPEEIIKKINLEHKKDLMNFNIQYDNYYSTHSNENKKLLILIYKRLQNKNLIKKRSTLQFFDTKTNIFLPDRFIKGNCPKCKSKNQYGDNCEICGAIYNPVDLINPKSTISNSTPIIKKSKHLFFNLPYFQNMLYHWIHSGILQKEIINKTNEWIKHGLKEWNISRDAPYFGFKIPNTKNKYFYVWLDATIGYMGSFKNFCKKYNYISFNKFWKKNSKHKLYHFIGKDIIYFHTLFWPAILEASEFRKPTKIFVHGYLMVNGKKMSKSRGTFVTAKNYLKHLDSDCLRYYYASKLSSNIKDINFNLENFVEKINTDIVNKIINLAARNASFINKYFNGNLSKKISNPILYKIFTDSKKQIEEAFDKRELNQVIKKIISLTNIANHYINEQAPWKIKKQNKKNENLQNICSMGIYLFKILMTYLKPILPSLVKKTEIFLNTSLSWKDIKKPFVLNKIQPFKKLFQRISINEANKIFKK
ncbi:Methionine--tRNA ligase [Candidatus Westeberhardia cardiocondylae]|uniref:Methionine--tRNA ligase n=1 Tax=Candidatus Westeberhardia cardiocondylae TaxID=1594731 RepID=A0A0H5C5L9_9ENTR|nr:methionine--tRNA ligase [Candidatus Westeberhardia cardiocondylae]MCR3756420.1 methionine--tRNA ligase [Candidatus Westeberhardia cardiocondylae]CEN32256.1 Methionine--tRNA ligase [Candidatus Westeberhardia cardiocondylae]